MGTIFSIIKTLELVSSFTSYFGAIVYIINKQIPDQIRETVNINSVLAEIFWYIFIVFIIIKIVWFCYSKFWLEAKERKQIMREKEKEKENENEK